MPSIRHLLSASAVGVLLALTSVEAFPSFASGRTYSQAKLQELTRRAFKPEGLLSGLADLAQAPSAAVPSSNNFVPVPDADHPFVAPTATDIRGPCPGLNAAANYGYLPHNGIVTFDQLVDAQQRVYNIAPDLAITLATIGVALDGDIVSQRLSLGRADPQATNALGALGNVLGTEGGLNDHNKFEGDASLTRNDYYYGSKNPNDNFSFNGTLYSDMKAYAAKNGGLYNFDTMASYRYARYVDSRANNPKFYFGPKSTLLYGAAAFLFRLFPNATGVPGYGIPDEATISAFFGAVADDTVEGGFRHVPERIPHAWYTRATPYTLSDVTTDLNLLLLGGDQLAQFGANAGAGNFIPDANHPIATTGSDEASRNAVACALYQAILDDVPSEFENVVGGPLQVVNYITNKLNPQFAQFGCQH